MPLRWVWGLNAKILVKKRTGRVKAMNTMWETPVGRQLQVWVTEAWFRGIQSRLQKPRTLENTGSTDINDESRSGRAGGRAQSTPALPPSQMTQNMIKHNQRPPFESNFTDSSWFGEADTESTSWGISSLYQNVMIWNSLIMLRNLNDKINDQLRKKCIHL